MLDLKTIDKILFLDIETVPQTASLSDLSPELQVLWDEKFNAIRRRMPDRYAEDATADYAFRNGGGIYSEFAKIVCISVGIIYDKNGQRHMRVKSFAGDDEAQLLRDFAEMATTFLTTREHRICGHNVKEFDVPFICRRMLINGIALPAFLDFAGQKPWTTPLIDTMELWRFGDYKSFTSLKLLCAIFGIPTPKDDIDGSQVADVYYNEHDVQRIAFYCEKDVVATAQVLLKMNGGELVAPEHITHVTDR
ncbi:MAG: 3'-5' exonuclease [Paludibacteraceae bacterium]